MAFQTSFLRNGEWVTETVNLQAALNASNTPKIRVEPESNTPTCGLLSRTIIESPIVHWVLPVRLRSRRNNDIAFIGSNFVQVSELQKTGQVHEVLRKDDFDLRIRNALVFGRGLDHSLDEDDPDMTDKAQSPALVLQDTQASTAGGYGSGERVLPPQMLVLVLETGDFVFLFIREHADGGLEFITTKQDGPRGVRYLGHHFALDPSSRYMAAASPDGILVVYELESMDALEMHYANQGSIKPVISRRIRPIQGVIHKVAFLYPRPEDDYHIILLLCLARKERGHSPPVSRMVTYEWELGDGLNQVFSEEKTGIRLPPEHKMPLLLIPLKFKTSFLIVSQHYVGLVKDALSGSPSFEGIPAQAPSRTELYHGLGEPLWTAWARPFRLKEYFQKTDVIYLAREDGAVQHIDIDTVDLLPSMTNVGCLNTNIDTAFAASFDRFSDMLIIAGDSGPGGIWKLAPRRDLERVAVLPNWSPVVDLTATHGSLPWNTGLAPDRMNSIIPDAKADQLSQPEVIFSASGRGLQGTVTEWRWGIPARVGLDLDLEEPTRQAWAFFMDTNEERTLNVILAVPHSSTILSFSEDLDQVNALPAEKTPFDLSSTTLAATQAEDDSVVQITETSITLVSATDSLRLLLDDILGMNNAIIQKASCLNDIAVVSCHNGPSSFQVYTIGIDLLDVSLINSWEVPGEVTCLLLLTLSGNQVVAVGSMSEGLSRVSFYSLNGEELASTTLRLEDSRSIAGCIETCTRLTGTGLIPSVANDKQYAPQFDALTSMCVVSNEGAVSADLVLGTRCGHLITMTISRRDSVDISWAAEKLGIAPLNVFPAHGLLDDQPAAFACCDNNLIMLRDMCPQNRKFKSKLLTWPTDSNDASMASPPIHSLHSLRRDPSRDRHQISMLLLSESRILLTEISPHIGPVPRSLPVGGTPTRIIFSQTYQCLVVALLVNNRPTLAFIDPASGRIMSEAIDKDQKPSDFISGLGQVGDRVTGLGEWLYVKDGKTFTFILVTTKAGNLLIVSATAKEVQTQGGPVRQIRYFTRNKKRYAPPIYSIVVDGDGIIFCVDRVLHWNVLDLAEKKLKAMKSFELESPATSLQILNGKIFALTTTHSLQVLDHRSEASSSEMTLLHTDRIARSTMHMIEAGSSIEPLHQWPIFMLSDIAGGIAGVWVPWGQRNKEFTVVFEGVLPTPVRRFIRIRSRPARQMANRHRRYGTLSSSVNEAEVFGVSVSGSLQHFTLISLELWRLLFLIKTLAQKNTTICPFAESPEVNVVEAEATMAMLQAQPKRMHVGGDVVERVLKQRALEELVSAEEDLESYCRCLDMLDDGTYTQAFQRGNPDDAADDKEEKLRKYFELGYEVLEYLFAPVL